MKKNEIKIGHVYKAKVSGKIVPVQIVKANPRGGWDGKNLSTGKAVRIKSAQRLRSEKTAATPAATSPRRAKTAKKATKDAKATPKADTAKRRGDGAKKPSGLDAVAKVLADAGEPMNCKAIVERMLAEGLWQTSGRTPSATIYSAIIREIRDKGEASRFAKVERGKFTLNS